MTAEEQKYVDLTARMAAMETGQVLMEGLLNKLPCAKYGEMIIEHEAVLKNGLKKAVRTLGETITNHVKAHDKDRTDKAKNKRGFYRGALLAALASGFAYGIPRIIELISSHL